MILNPASCIFNNVGVSIDATKSPILLRTLCGSLLKYFIEIGNTKLSILRIDDDGRTVCKIQMHAYTSSKGITIVDTIDDTQMPPNAKKIDDGFGLSNANGANINPRANPGAAKTVSNVIKVSIT